MKNRLEQIITLKLNNFEIKVPEAKGTEPVDVQESKEAKKLGNPNGMFADYPWESCIADQIERYGDEEIAKRVCGWIKANYQTNFQEGDSLEGACWPGYVAVGLKPGEGGRMVPNCVPEKEGMSKEEFVIPKPKSGENESDFIGRCNSELYNEFPDNAQRNAVCYKSWRGE